MPTSIVDADSLVAIDVGGVTTRAMLFDVVDGRYRFIAAGTAPTTVNAPFHDASEGIRLALDQLEAITGRVLTGQDERLIVPSRTDGAGVDMVAATISAGPPLKVVAVGLLEDISLESARRLATTTYASVVESIGLNDRRRPEARIDAILRLRPDLILAAGGTEGGASQSVLKLMETVGLAGLLLPEGQRPAVLFAGNQDLSKEIRSSLGKLVPLHLAPNVRPALEVEQLEAAQSRLADLFRVIRGRQVRGVQELDQLAKGNLQPTAMAFGRIIRYLSKVYDSPKGVLGVDVGATATTLAAGFSGQLSLGVYPELGLGSGLAAALEKMDLSEISRWLPVEISDEALRDYLINKSLYPASLPASVEDLAIEQALARAMLRRAAAASLSNFPARLMRYGPDILPWFEPIVASGSVFTRAPSLGQSLLMLLDGLQPTGVTTVVLDQNHLTPALGAAAAVNPLMTAQVLDSSTFLNLGPVISPVGQARHGTPILRFKMTTDDGFETSLEVKQGALEIVPLALGQPARLHLQPLNRFDVGMGGPGKGGALRVPGGALGLIIDARGRPLRLPNDAGHRREVIRKWLWTFGGSA